MSRTPRTIGLLACYSSAMSAVYRSPSVTGPRLENFIASLDVSINTNPRASAANLKLSHLRMGKEEV